MQQSSSSLAAAQQAYREAQEHYEAHYEAQAHLAGEAGPPPPRGSFDGWGEMAGDAQQQAWDGLGQTWQSRSYGRTEAAGDATVHAAPGDVAGYGVYAAGLDPLSRTDPGPRPSTAGAAGRSGAPPGSLHKGNPFRKSGLPPTRSTFGPPPDADSLAIHGGTPKALANLAATVPRKSRQELADEMKGWVLKDYLLKRGQDVAAARQ